MKPDNGHLDLERLDLTDAPELQRALDTVKQQLPHPQQLATLAASLSQMGISVTPPHAAAPIAPSAARLKVLLGAGVVGPLAIALLLWRSPVTQSAPPSEPEAPATPTPALDATLEAPQRSTADPNQGKQRRASAVASDVAPPSAPPADSGARSAGEVSSAPQPHPGPAPIRATPATPLQPAAAESTRAPVASARVTTDSVGPGVVTRPTEVALLRDARLALNRNPSEALALAEQHRALFARGAMVQERELIAISALARLGRHTAVLARAAQFERDFPTSPYRKQVSALAQ